MTARASSVLIVALIGAAFGCDQRSAPSTSPVGSAAAESSPASQQVPVAVYPSPPAAGPTVSITSPSSGATVKCDEFTQDNQCLCRFEGQATGVSQQQYVCLFMKVPGGDTWWVSGNCIRGDEFDGTWKQMWSTCGGRGQHALSLVARALVLDRAPRAGSNHAELPRALAQSALVELRR